jgi:hypothetical protein
MKRSKTPSLELEAEVGLPFHTETCADERDARSSGASPLVGDVLESASVDFPGRVLVRWRTVDGVLNERWLCPVRGLVFKRGDLVLVQQPGNWPEWLITHVIGGSPAPDEPSSRQTDEKNVEAAVDNNRIELEGKDELVLRCGQASITLRRNGRVIVRGTYVESRSKGTNRIKGGVVLIN